MDTLKLLTHWTEDPTAQLWAPVFVVSLVSVFCLLYGFHYFLRSFLLRGTLKKSLFGECTAL